MAWELSSTLRQKVAAGRADFIKRSFLSSVGQVVAVTGFVPVMLRMLR